LASEWTWMQSNLLMARTCVFCKGTPVTNEHVWPEWAGALLRTISSDPRPFRLGGLGKGWQTAKFDSKVKRVCGKCNNEWMSELEGRAQPILTPMILGQQRAIILSPADQQILARWAFKTALMSEFASPKQEVGIRTYEGFYQHRRPPDQCVIWTAAYSTTTTAARVHRLLITLGTVDTKKDDAITAQDSPGIVITFNLFKVIFQVALYEGARRTTLPDSHSLVQRIWPVDGPLVWPAKGNALSHEAFERFATRVGLL
jgi:hypothetical protein